jgi:hypothetical protein
MWFFYYMLKIQRVGEKMKLTKAKYMIFPLFAALLIATLNTYVSRVSAAGPTIYLEPSSSVFYTNETRIGDRFNVTVLVDEASNVGGAQIHLEFDDSIINVTRWFEPKNDPEYIFYGRGTTALPTPPDPNYLHISANKGRVEVAVSLFPTEEPWFDGDGKICIFEFKVTAAPPEDGELTCALHINTADTYLIDGDTSEEVPGVTKEDGTYTFSWAGVPPPYLAVDPVSVRFGPYTSALDHTFDLTIYVKDVVPAHSLENVTFSLTYNQTLVSTGESNVTIDDLWEGPNEVVVSGGKVNVTVTNPSTTPTGNVPTVTITFKVEYQGTSPPLPLGSFEKSEFVLVDYELWGTSEIETSAPQNGKITIYAYRTVNPVLEISEPVIIGSGTDILPGTSFNISITITNVVDLQRANVKIIYNPSIIVVTDIDVLYDNIFHVIEFEGEASYTVNNTGGYLIYEGLFPTDHPTFTGSGLLFKITFTGQAYGLSYLNISTSETALRDSAGDIIPLEIVNKNIQVIPEFSALLILPLFMCLTIIVATVYKKRLVKQKT